MADMETTARNDYNSEPVDAFTFPLICFFQCREMGMKTLKRFDEKSGLLPKPYTASVHPHCLLRRGTQAPSRGYI